MSTDDAFPSLANRAWFLTGPTASGKSSVAACLATRIDAEIISVDSMTIYRRMDVGTAKPSAAQRAQVPHHLLDVIDPDSEYSVADFLRSAHSAVADIESRGIAPLFVGGTPMWLKGCLRGFDPGPPADWEFRESVEAEIQAHGIEALYERLRQVDPLSAHQLHPNDRRRIIRALEVARATGGPISHRQVQFETENDPSQVRVFALQWPRDALHQRIQRRVDRMFAAGLVDEVASIVRDFPRISRTAMQAVGYKEVIEHLNGNADIAETIEKVKAHTRQLARRQETWLRSLREVRFIEMNDDRTAEEVAREIVELCRA